MKIIDLLNKIANGEELPNHIRYTGIDLYYNKKNNCYDLIMSNVREEFYTFSYSDLNNEVEIIEEKKIPEKLEIEQDTPSSNYYIRNENGTKCSLTKHSKMIADTLNEIIDYLKSKGE